MQYVYDELGRLVAVVAPNGESAVYTYDAVGNLLSIARHAASAVTLVEFTPNGGPIGAAVTLYGTGFSTTPLYNQALSHALARGLTHPQRSSIGRSLLAQSQTWFRLATGPVLSLINLSLGIRGCVVQEYNEGVAGNCIP